MRRRKGGNLPLPGPVTRYLPRGSLRVDRLPGRAWIAAAQPGADLGWVAGEILADDVQAELAQDRGGGLAFQKELERRRDQFLGGDMAAAEAGGKSGRHAYLVAGARTCRDVVDAIGLADDGDLRHAVTLASRHSMHAWPTVAVHGCRGAPLSVDGRCYSEERHKPAAYIAWLPQLAGCLVCVPA